MDMNQTIREIKKGILKWYPFLTGAKCLYIGETSDAIFEMLTDKDDYLIRDLHVDCVSPHAVSNVSGEYDYIIAVESFEILEDVATAIRELTKHVKKDGHLLLGFNNRFGTRYFFGDRDPYTNNIFDGIEDYRRAYNKKEDTYYGRCYDKRTILDILNDCGLQHQDYSVFPNFQTPQIIMRDDYESNEDFSIRILPTYHHADTVFMEEEWLYNSLQKNHMLHSMANAFLFDCTFGENELGILQVTSSMGRSTEDSFFTLIREDEKNDNERVVEKVPAYREGEKKLQSMVEISRELKQCKVETVQMELIEKENVHILQMPFVKAPTAQAYLKELAKEDEDLFVKKLDEFVELIKGVGDKGYPDLVPLNCFYMDDKFVFFDQEFSIPDYPVEAVVFRSVCAMGPAITACEKYTIDELYRRYGLNYNLAKWQSMEWEFISNLRKEKELAPYFSKMRYDGNKVYSNRLRMNFSAEEYLTKFVNIFKDLDKKQVIVFGSGLFAKQFMQMYGGDYNVVSIIDNRQDKWGEEFFGLKISGAEVLKEFEPGSYRVIVCIKNFLSVTNQLEELGVRDYGIFDPSQQYIRERRGTSQTTQALVTDVNESATPKKYHTGYIAGVFDLFHVGHLEKFKLAKEQCDYLIVGLVTDEGVKQYKKTTPFIPFEDRKAMLEACRYVDEVVKIPPNFGGTRDAWKMYGFDVQFSGSDYANDPSWKAEKQFLEEHGVDMVFFPYTESTSSSKLKALIDQKLI